MEYQTEVVKLYYANDLSPAKVKQLMKRKYPALKPFSRFQIRRIVKKFDEFGTVNDRRPGNSGRHRDGRSSENVDMVRDIIEEAPKKSIRRVLGEIQSNIDIGRSTVQRIMKEDLNLKPYRIQVMQHLKDTDIMSRFDFANWVLENSDIMQTVWFSDEAHFNLNGQVNKQNLRYWSTTRPEFYEERPLHCERVTVWAAMSSTGVIGPYFYEESGKTATVTAERYITILRTKFIPALRKITDMDTVWYQQDGAAPHTANVVLNFLTQVFPSRHISLKTDFEWPPHSPDLNPLDFFMWGYLKERVYSPPPANLKELKSAIRREMRRISAETCKSTIQNFMKRSALVVQESGRHFEHIL